MRWGSRPTWARWVTAGYVIGFLEGTAAHAYFVAADGLDAYDYAPVPIQVLFHALLVLDPLVAALVAGARPAGPLLGAAVMLADVVANWWVQWDAVLADPAAYLLRLVGLPVLTLFGIFVLTTALPLRRALHRTADGATNG